MRISCDAADVVFCSVAKVTDGYIITSGDAAGLFTLGIAESFGVIRMGDRYLAEIASP